MKLVDAKYTGVEIRMNGQLLGALDGDITIEEIAYTASEGGFETHIEMAPKVRRPRMGRRGKRRVWRRVDWELTRLKAHPFTIDMLRRAAKTLRENNVPSPYGYYYVPVAR